MKIIFSLILLVIFNVYAYANEDVLDYFYVEGVNVNKIYITQTKKLNDDYVYVAAYAVNTNTTWKDNTVGIFIKNKSGIEVIDIFHPMQEENLIPSIHKYSPTELIVGIYSSKNTSYRTIKYLIDIKANEKVVSKTDLQTDEIPNDADITKALKLADKNNYEEALTLLAPCLNISSGIDRVKHEKCLYHGELIATNAMRTLINRYYNDKRLSIAYGSIDNWLSSMGLKAGTPNICCAEVPEYENNYIKTLIQLFPNSKHKDIYDFVVIERGENSMPPVQKWIDSLLAYRKNHPSGYYIFNATNDLANTYDNLWDILTPTTEFSGYYFHNYAFTSGNKELDIKNAKQYRNDALNLYKYLIEHGNPKDKNEERYLHEAKKRFKELTNKKRSNAFYIIND